MNWTISWCRKQTTGIHGSGHCCVGAAWVHSFNYVQTSYANSCSNTLCREHFILVPPIDSVLDDGYWMCWTVTVHLNVGVMKWWNNRESKRHEASGIKILWLQVSYIRKMTELVSHNSPFSLIQLEWSIHQCMTLKLSGLPQMWPAYPTPVDGLWLWWRAKLHT